jgi:hypothetical protein
MAPSPLVIERDRFLRQSDGSQFDWFGHIDFMLFWKSLADGFPIEPHLDARQVVEDQVVVTLMMAHFIEHRDPASQGERFFAHIKPFAQALAVKNWYWMPIVFADAQVIMPDRGHQQNFLQRCAAEFAGESNVLPSLGNELSKNGVDASIFSKPSGNLWSRGSEVGDTAPYRPGWDWKEWHPRRDWPKVLFGNDDAWYVKEGIDAGGTVLDTSMPCIVTEPIGFWDRDVPNRRSSDPNLARVIGGTARYFARGVNIMSEEGLHSDPWTPNTLLCAQVMARAMRQP